MKAMMTVLLVLFIPLYLYGAGDVDSPRQPQSAASQSPAGAPPPAASDDSGAGVASGAPSSATAPAPSSAPGRTATPVSSTVSATDPPTSPPPASPPPPPASSAETASIPGPAGYTRRVQLLIFPLMGMGVSKTEGERVALAISNISDLNRVCKVLDPRLLVQEPAIPQQIPPPDTTDPGILTIGRKYGAEYVLTSQVSQLGRQRVIILTVVEVSSGRLVTGGYREIREIRDVDMLVPNIVRNMVQVIAQDTGKAPNLGVSPLTVSPLIRSTVEDITVLGYLLFIELANTGKYKVMRRLSGDRTEGVRNLGALLKAPYILKVNVTPLDDRNRVLAQIIELEENTDSVFRGGAVQYRNIGDGIQLMSDLAYQLTDVRDRGMPNIFVPENMVWVAGGTFRMGSQVYNGDENPVHMVQVNSFFMSKTQVTQEEYSRVMGTNPSRFQNPGAPVERITWYEAIEYCNKLSQREGLIPAYSGNNDRIIWDSSANGYRLPTEAEWEYAAQGGNVETLNFNLPGGNGGDGLAWYKGNSGGITHRVATKTANILGLYDMAGNVWEWCWDRYGPYDEKTQYNPRGPGLGLNRVVRGGSWNSEEAELRLTYRHIGNPEQRYSDVGFRVVRPRF